MQKRIIPVLLFVAYAGILIKVIVFKNLPVIRVGHLMLNFAGTDGGHPANFVPFTTIVPYLFGYKGWIIAGINLVGNVALLVPLGFLLPFVIRNATWKKSLAMGVVAGLAIELMQTLLRVGIFDIDDVILNALGVLLGYIACVILVRWVRTRNYVGIVLAVIALVVAALGALYLVDPGTREAINSNVGAGNQRESIDRGEEDTVPHGSDPCNGTAGTGQIVSRGSDSIDIKSKAGVTQRINLTAQTEIKNSAGPISGADLKVGDRVTVVIMDESKNATAVLVCGVSATQ